MIYHGSVYHNGKRYRKKLSITRNTALKLLKEFEYNILFKPSDAPIKPQIPLKQARISFLKKCELSGVSDKHLQVLSYTTRRVVEFAENKEVLLLSEFTSELAMDFFSKRSKNNTHIAYRSFDDEYKPTISNATLKKELQIIKRLFNHCVELDWINKNPFRMVKSPKVDTSKQRYFFSESEVELILSNAGQFKDFYLLLFHTGLRSTDAYKLKNKHIQGRYLSIKMNKTKDLLNIPISVEYMNTLKVILEVYSDENDYLFPCLQSNRQQRNCCKNLQSNFTVEKVRDKNINLHTFRHTYAHNMLNKGVPKEVLQTLLGHRSIKTTEIYANWVRKEELERWVT